MKCPYSNPTPQQCLNCPCPDDCVNDELSMEEYRSKEIDNLNNPPDKKVIANRKSTAKYDAANRDKKRAGTKKNYDSNPEKKKDQVKEWQKQNYQYLLLYQKEWRAKKKAERDKVKQ